MHDYQLEYNKLNYKQRLAVDTIDGPVMILAGPGTGKTQLLAMRVANILKKTDISPANILCLTFTDNAARNMRERLENIVGQPAFHVSIHTFHSFGTEIINQFPDHFRQRLLLSQIDDIGIYALLREIFDQLPHSNPLSAKLNDEYIMLSDCAKIISRLKQNGLSSSEFKVIISSNKKLFIQFSQKLAETFSQPTSPKYINKYFQLLKSFQLASKNKILYGFPEYIVAAAEELELAIESTQDTGRYAPRITDWRNKWCEKNDEGMHVFKDDGRNLSKITAVSDVYDSLQNSLSQKGLFDFDDMIIQTVQALEEDSELASNLQERYQYILVDEFQDTNKAQLRILKALGNNPIYENRPNIMVVGDDDQAIYAFQGAEVSNMVQFLESYSDPLVVSLVDNYRSNDAILTIASQIGDQITDRISKLLPTKKTKLIANIDSSEFRIEQAVLSSELSQYKWIAEQIKRILESGTMPQEIAVIAPKHRYLERLIPYLVSETIPVSYERRENILESPIIIEILKTAELIYAIHRGDHKDIDSLLANVLSYSFWGLKNAELIEISMASYDGHKHWLETILKAKNNRIIEIVNWFIDLSKQSSTQPLEYILDSIIGIDPAEFSDKLEKSATSVKKFNSPMMSYYFSNLKYEHQTDKYLATLGQLSTIRQKLRQWKPDKTLFIYDLLDYVNLHRQANIKIIDTNPHTQSTNAVQVMTAYKAKGLEFETVFIINVQDEVWGPTSKNYTSRITLPKNLPLDPASDGNNDKLRLFYVSLTRAKYNLIITSYSHNLENKLSQGLSFIGGNTNIDQTINKLLQPVQISTPNTALSAEILSTDWAYRFRQIIADKKTLFEPILKNYKLSVTHLNNFIDVAYNGPNYYLVHNLLRFPQAPTPPAAYGDSIHKAIQWYYSQLKESREFPDNKKIIITYQEILAKKHLKTEDYNRYEIRGTKALLNYIKYRSENFKITDLIERGFNNEGVVVNDAKLSGKIDKIKFKDQQINSVIDFKTGKPSSNWRGKDNYEQIKLHRYKQQLMFYKLLIDGSASFSKRAALNRAELEFIETNSYGKLADNLILEFDLSELETFKQLIKVVWQHIQDLNFPDTANYSKNLAGVKNFESDMINGSI